MALSSDIELSLPEATRAGLAEIRIRSESRSFFSSAIAGQALQARSERYHFGCLKDGSTYVRWDGLGEFLVSSAGNSITYGRDATASWDAFQVYLLGQAFSFALLRMGFEPLHATTVAVDGEAVAFLGSSGFGKSSLAACFVGSGYRLLTDDLLLVQPGLGGLDAYPGPARIKLVASVARRFLGHAKGGVMNAHTPKIVIPLEAHQSWQLPLSLRAVYALGSPYQSPRPRNVRIQPLSLREAFLAVVGNSFNSVLVDRARLHRQVVEATRLLNSVTVKRLCYPRVLTHLPVVRDAIVRDVKDSRLIASSTTSQ